MIKIKRANSPKELTDEVKMKLTKEYIKTNKPVWNKKYIKETLLKMSEYKCCYCETKLDEESKYMEVEHFHDKKSFPHKVVEWENLLPSCKRCNGYKGTHDTIKEPIINPTKDNPKDYLFMKLYRFYPKDKCELGKNTIDVIYLNDSDKLYIPRALVGQQTLVSAEELMEVAVEYSKNINRNTKRKNIIISGVKHLLREANPSSQYSAIVSTVLLKHFNFNKLKDILAINGLWDFELERLYQSALEICLDTS